MTSWDGKTRGTPLGYRIFIFLLKILSIQVSYFVLRFVACWFFCFTDKKAIYFYFRKIQHYSRLRSWGAVYKNFYLFGQVLLDRIAILGGMSDKFSFDFDGEEHLHRMAAGKTGGILVGAHVGNWEIAGQLLERIDAKIHIVMYDGEQGHIKDLMAEVIVKKKIDIIYIREGDGSYLNAIDEALKNKHIIAMHGDRFLPGMNTCTADFMTYPADFPTGPFHLAAKYQVPLVHVSAMKESCSHYHFYATAPVLYKYPGSLKERKEELARMVNDYVAELERMIKLYPCQWFNYYQFWKTNSF